MHGGAQSVWGRETWKHPEELENMMSFFSNNVLQT